MKTKSRNSLIASLTMIVMMIAILFGVVAIAPLTAYAASSVRVDFCLTNGALENNVFFENDSSKYFMSQQTKADGTLTSLEELYRTDNLDLEFDGWYTEKGEKVSLETVFTEYTILYDRWKPTTLTDEDIISTLEIGTPLLEVGQTAGTYDTSSILLTDNRLSVQSVSVYEGLNAYRTNKLDDSDVLEAGKSYSLRIELHTKSGELIDDQLMSHSTATYGLVANMVYSHDNSGIFTTQWTNRENKIQVIINYDYENYYFTSDLVDKIVENGQSPQYTVSVSNNANVQGMELFVKNANDTWASLGAVTGQFNIPANSNVIKQYRVEITYQNGFVISSNTFKVEWYDPNAPKFITQPTDYSVAYGTDVLVTWGLNCDVSAIYLDKFNGETYSQYQNATPTGATVDAFAESGTYTFRVHAVKDGGDIYSDSFTITWREAFEFTTQPQSVTVSTGESIVVTWETNLLQTELQTLGAFQLQTDTGSGWHRSANLAENATSFDFGTSYSAYSQKYRLMANYDSVLYYSDEFTIEYIAGVFTSKPADEINAIVGKDCLVEWDFNLDVKYYDIKVHDGNDFVPFATTDKPEYVFTASEVGNKQYFVQAYNANDQLIGAEYADYLMFRINWTEQQIVYLVSFNANGGTGTMQPVEQNAGSQYTLPTCTFTAPDGKIFKAWSVNDVEKQVGDQITINANTVVKAVWEDNEVIYSYCTNGAEGSNDTNYATVGEEITLADCMFTAPEGKQFKAWAIGGLGGVQKQPGDEITITEETYIYAVWEDITYTVSFNANGGAGSMLDETEQLGGYVLPECTFTAPTGMQFKCWAEGSASGQQYDVGYEYDVTANVTFYAVWEDIPVATYTVSFNANGGSGSMNPVQFAGEYTLPTCGFTAPTGKQFKGWATSANGSVIEGTTYNVTANVEFFAIWENIPVTNYTINATAGANGSISPSGEVTVAEGEDKTFTITANSGYHIKDVKVNGSSVGAVATYTFNDVAANATITVEFEVDTVPHVCNPTLVPKVEPNCTTAGKSAYYHCECGKNYEDAQGNSVISNLETWGILNALGHEAQDVWSTDGEYHWHKCTRCEEQLDKAAHADENNDGKCDICDYAMGNAENPGGDIEPEKTGLSGGAIAGIVVGSVAVAGLGGFAIFWFVIKKKKFADLIALFKKK